MGGYAPDLTLGRGRRSLALQLDLFRTVPGWKPRLLWEFPSVSLLSVSLLELPEQQSCQPCSLTRQPWLPVSQDECEIWGGGVGEGRLRTMGCTWVQGSSLPPASCLPLALGRAGQGRAAGRCISCLQWSSPEAWDNTRLSPALSCLLQGFLCL